MTILYSTARSANGRKVLALAQHLALDVEVRTVDVYRGDGRAEAYKALNPWGKIPTLVDGEFVLWESNAILVYFAELARTPALLGDDPRRRAHVLRWLFWESSHWQPTLARILAPRVSQLLVDATQPVAMSDWNDAELIRLVAYLESELACHEYVAGERLSIADFSVAGMTTYFGAARFPAHLYPAISGWMQRMLSLRAWAATAVAPWI